VKNIIEVRGLAKRFGGVDAVAGVDFDVHEGEVFGFLGPNGAGKTTTINMLAGLARPDAGAIRIAGVDCAANPKAAQGLMGVVPDESNLYPELSGLDNLCFCGALYGMRKSARTARAGELLQAFGLAEASGRKFGGYSKGMKRRLAIAAALMHSPAILFLDEPTTGIDVAGARRIRQIIAGLRSQGTTVFLTTHYIEEAERLCQRIAFIVKGRIVRVERTEDLLRQAQGRHVVQFAVNNCAAALLDAVKAAFPALSCAALGGGALRVESAEPVRIGPIVRLLEEKGAEVSEARLVRPSLEEVFVQITGIEVDAMKMEKDKGGKGGGA